MVTELLGTYELKTTTVTWNVRSSWANRDCADQASDNPPDGALSSGRGNKAGQHISTRAKFIDRPVVLLERHYVRATLHREPRQTTPNLCGEPGRNNPQRIFSITVALRQHAIESRRRCIERRVSRFPRPLDTRTRFPNSVELNMATETRWHDCQRSWWRYRGQGLDRIRKRTLRSRSYRKDYRTIFVIESSEESRSVDTSLQDKPAALKQETKSCRVSRNPVKQRSHSYQRDGAKKCWDRNSQACTESVL